MSSKRRYLLNKHILKWGGKQERVQKEDFKKRQKKQHQQTHFLI